MNIVFQSAKFNVADIVSSYARLYSNGEVKFFDVNMKGKTIREWYTTQDKVEIKGALREGETVLYTGLSMQERAANCLQRV